MLALSMTTLTGVVVSCGFYALWQRASQEAAEWCATAEAYADPEVITQLLNEPAPEPNRPNRLLRVTFAGDGEFFIPTGPSPYLCDDQ